MSARGNSVCGIALDGTTLTVAWRSAHDGGVWRWERTTCDSTPDGIATALAELGPSAPSRVPVSVTLLRPLANARTVRFPPMARAALERVLSRDWARYVIGLRDTPHTVAARQLDRGRWRATFAPTKTLDAFADAARQYEWPHLAVQTADDALSAVVRAVGTEARRDADLLVVVCDATGPVDAVHLHGGEPLIGRRFLSGATDADVLAFIRAAPIEPDAARRVASAPAIVIGTSPRAEALARTLQEAGHHARLVDMGAPVNAPAEAMLAIAGVTEGATLQLLSPAARAVRARTVGSLVRGLWVAAAAALLLAFALERWGVHSALASVRQQRADISSPVSNAVRARAALETSTETVAALSDYEASASRAASVMSAVAVALPTGTSLTVLSVHGDSMTVEGESGRSTAVYDALRAIPLLGEVRLAAPLRQERQTGDVTVERFAFTARVREATSSRAAAK